MNTRIRKWKEKEARNKAYQFIRQDTLEETGSIPQYDEHQVLPCRVNRDVQ